VSAVHVSLLFQHRRGRIHRVLVHERLLLVVYVSVPQGMNPQQGFPGMTPQHLVGAPAIQRATAPVMSVPSTPMIPPQPAMAPSPAVKPAPTPAPTPSPAAAASAVADTPNVNELLKKLLAAGIIGQPKKEEKEAVAPPATAASLQEKPEPSTPTPSSSEEKLTVSASKPKVCQIRLVVIDLE